jgi:chromosome segregation ATPase
MHVKVEEFQKQEDDLKKLLEELVSERTDLQKENRKLYTEQEFRIGEQEQLEANCKLLQAEATSTRQEIQEWKDKCESLVPDLESSRKYQLDLEREVEALKTTQERLNALQIENNCIIGNNEKLQEEIAAVKEEKDRIEVIVTNMTKNAEEKAEAERVANEKVAEAERIAEEMAENEMKKESEEEIEVEQSRNDSEFSPPPPPPPRRPSHLASPQVPKQNDVPLRSLRKTLSRATGLHGVLTPSSKIIKTNEQTRPSSGTHPRPGAKPNDTIQRSEGSEEKLSVPPPTSSYQQDK